MEVRGEGSGVVSAEAVVEVLVRWRRWQGLGVGRRVWKGCWERNEGLVGQAEFVGVAGSDALVAAAYFGAILFAFGAADLWARGWGVVCCWWVRFVRRGYWG